MKLLMAANWKMHKTRAEAKETVEQLLAAVSPIPADREVALFVPFTALSACMELLPAPGVSLGAQNCHSAVDGAFTGEVSPGMLIDSGCTMVLVGHSERRALFGETDQFIGAKTASALAAGLKVILCVGETLTEREDGKLQEVLVRQLTAGLSQVERNKILDISVAYEPVWAIGTGRVAGPKEIEEAHTLLYHTICSWDVAAGSVIRILYGGSVKPDNAATIIQIPHVNGVLVGGASLQATVFRDIVLA